MMLYFKYFNNRKKFAIVDFVLSLYKNYFFKKKTTRQY